MNPYSPPKSEVTERKPRRIGQRLLGGLCVFLGGAMLIGGIPQLVAALRLLINPNTLNPKTPASPGGYLLGTLFGLALAALLLRSGIRKFRGQANKPLQSIAPTDGAPVERSR